MVRGFGWLSKFVSDDKTLLLAQNNNNDNNPLANLQLHKLAKNPLVIVI